MTQGIFRSLALSVALVSLLCGAGPPLVGQVALRIALPDAPTPQNAFPPNAEEDHDEYAALSPLPHFPCASLRDPIDPMNPIARQEAANATPDVPPEAEQRPGPRLQGGLAPAACPGNISTTAGPAMCCEPSTRPFQHFLNSQRDRALTPHQKLELAGRHLIDPFNALTILATSAISVASDPDSVYGPGGKGFARSASIVYTEGVTGEFFGTFLIPSLAHQDPHYHRTPNASTQRRIVHAIYAVVWAQSDSGRPMFNYANVVGTVVEDMVDDAYVPGRRIGPGASAARIGTSFATDPIDNLVTEFVPDIARRVKVRVVFLQRIINQVAQQESRTASD
jgi:hypothetical protein